MSSLGVLPDPLTVSADCSLRVGSELPVNDVRDASFQGSDGFLAGLALGEFLLVVVATFTWVAELGDRGHMKDVVEFAIAAGVESMPGVVAR